MSAPACLQLTQVARIRHTLRMLNKQIEMETGHETEIEAQAWPKFTITCNTVAVASTSHRLVLANEHNVGAHCVWLI